MKNKEIARFLGALLSFFLNMPKRNFIYTLKQVKRVTANSKAFTLLELLVSSAIISGFILVVFDLFGTGTKLAGYFNSSIAIVDSVNSSLQVLNSILPQVVRIDRCGCGTAADSNVRSECLWSESSPWVEPNQSPGTERVLLAGVAEMYFGGANILSTAQLLKDNINLSIGTCDSYAGFSTTSILQKGCKMPILLTYTKPRPVQGTASSLAGKITLYRAASLADADKKILLQIGDSDVDGDEGIGVTALSCGFVRSAPASGVSFSGAQFALNFKLKARSTKDREPYYSLSTPNPNYEGWTATDPNFYRGISREVRFRYSFPNISTRGVYQWRTTSIQKCIAAGAASATADSCCSLASDGSNCLSQCVPSGLAASNPMACCSEKVSGGLCI